MPDFTSPAGTPEKPDLPTAKKDSLVETEDQKQMNILREVIAKRRHLEEKKKKLDASYAEEKKKAEAWKEYKDVHADKTKDFHASVTGIHQAEADIARIQEQEEILRMRVPFILETIPASKAVLSAKELDLILWYPGENGAEYSTRDRRAGTIVRTLQKKGYLYGREDKDGVIMRITAPDSMPEEPVIEKKMEPVAAEDPAEKAVDDKKDFKPGAAPEPMWEEEGVAPEIPKKVFRPKRLFTEELLGNIEKTKNVEEKIKVHTDAIAITYFTSIDTCVDNIVQSVDPAMSDELRAELWALVEEAVHAGINSPARREHAMEETLKNMETRLSLFLQKQKTPPEEARKISAACVAENSELLDSAFYDIQRHYLLLAFLEEHPAAYEKIFKEKEDRLFLLEEELSMRSQVEAMTVPLTSFLKERRASLRRESRKDVMPIKLSPPEKKETPAPKKAPPTDVAAPLSPKLPAAPPPSKPSEKNESKPNPLMALAERLYAVYTADGVSSYADIDGHVVSFDRQKPDTAFFLAPSGARIALEEMTVKGLNVAVLRAAEERWKDVMEQDGRDPYAGHRAEILKSVFGRSLDEGVLDRRSIAFIINSLRLLLQGDAESPSGNLHPLRMLGLITNINAVNPVRAAQLNKLFFYHLERIRNWKFSDICALVKLWDTEGAYRFATLEELHDAATPVPLPIDPQKEA